MPADAGGGHQVLGRGEPVVEPGVLGEHPGAAAHLVGLDGGVEAEHGRRAAVGREHAVEQADRRGLAGAVRAEQGEDLAFGHVDREPVECDRGAEPAGEAVGADRDGAHLVAAPM